MHAIFHFAMHLEPDTEEKDLAEEALEVFRNYEENHADENNWSSPIDLVTNFGKRVVTFKDQSDRYEPMEEASWEDAIRHAMMCVITDMEIVDLPILNLMGLDEKQKEQRDKLDTMSMSELVELVNTAAPKRLIELYKKIEPQLPSEAKFDMDNYRRARLSREFEHFQASYKLPPFTKALSSPYEYRAYDLSGYYTDGEPNAILRVDIHT
jgi:hypothetical protein